MKKTLMSMDYCVDANNWTVHHITLVNCLFVNLFIKKIWSRF